MKDQPKDRWRLQEIEKALYNQLSTAREGLRIAKMRNAPQSELDGLEKPIKEMFEQWLELVIRGKEPAGFGKEGANPP
jgi:hypothetical protein